MNTHQLKHTALAAMIALLIAPVSAQAAAPMAKTQAPGFHRMMLGAFEITALSDGTVDLPMDELLSGAPAKTRQGLAKAHLTVPLETSVNVYLINTGSKLVLVDSGAASSFGPTLGKLLTNLKSAGYEASQIDEVLITHFHGDHVGGLLDAGKAAFPNATVRADKRESDFWLSQDNMDKAPADKKYVFKNAMAATQPYVASGKFQAFNGNTEFVPGIRATSAYGHTPGHTSYLVESQGQRLLLIGDLIHVGALQFKDPAMTIKFDSDPKAAAASRGAAFRSAAQEGMLIGATHLSFPGIGHVYSEGKSYRWAPANYTRAR